MLLELDAARRLLSEGQGSLAAELLESGGTASEIATSYHRVAKDLYWKDKDLAGARSALALGIAYAVDEARATTEAALADELKGQAKAMCYDLASFCWPGWGEPGIDIGEAEMECGEQAAAENLRLAIELHRGDMPMANAHFMVGAFHLARRRFAYAEASFAEFRRHASQAGDPGTVLLADGYLALVKRLESEDGFKDACKHLRLDGGEHGGFFADQLETAATVFG